MCVSRLKITRGHSWTNTVHCFASIIKIPFRNWTNPHKLIILNLMQNQSNYINKQESEKTLNKIFSHGSDSVLRIFWILIFKWINGRNLVFKLYNGGQRKKKRVRIFVISLKEMITKQKRALTKTVKITTTNIIIHKGYVRISRLDTGSINTFRIMVVQ